MTTDPQQTSRQPRAVIATEHRLIDLAGETLPLPVRADLIKRLTVENPAYVDALKFGRSTHGLPAKLHYFEHLLDDGLQIPRGARSLLKEICRAHGVALEHVDRTHQSPLCLFRKSPELSPAQGDAVWSALKEPKGQLVAPAGGGKTVMALAMIAQRKQPALVLVHRKELGEQFRARAVQFLGMDPKEVGQYWGSKKVVGDRLTIATIQSLSRDVPRALINRIGFVVVDEAHHVPALTLAGVIRQFPAHYLLGLSATPYRSDGLGPVIDLYVGPMTALMTAKELPDRLITPSVFKRQTRIQINGDTPVEIVTRLTQHSGRNRLIVADVHRAVSVGRRCIILSDRVDHVELLTRMLQDAGIRADSLFGGKPRKARQARQAVIDALAAGTLDAVVATGSLIGEGFDVPRLDTLFLATPFSYEGRLTQYVGRICRTAPGKTDAFVIDYVDDNALTVYQWNNRRQTYAAAAYAWKTA